MYCLTEMATMMHKGVSLAANNGLRQLWFKELNNIHLFMWPKLKSIDALAIGVSGRIVVFNVRHSSHVRRCGLEI